MTVLNGWSSFPTTLNQYLKVYAGSMDHASFALHRQISGSVSNKKRLEFLTLKMPLLVSTSPNKDLLILHLQRVAAQQEANKISLVRSD